MKRIIIFKLLLLVVTTSFAQKVKFFVGTTDDQVKNSIALCELNEETENIELLNKCIGGKRPGYLTISNNGKFLYAVSTEIFQGNKSQNTINAFSILDEGNRLKKLNKQSCLGVNPCHISLSPNEEYIFSANYNSGSIVALPVNKDGSLAPASCHIQHEGSSVNSERQNNPHAHYIHSSNDGRFVFVADLGIDKIMNYKLSSNGKLLPNKNQNYLKLTPGAGPRHMAFHPNGKQIFILNELNSTVVSCNYNASSGNIEKADVKSTLPTGFKGKNKAAAIRIHPNGKYLYCSNRGNNSIAVFKIKKSGLLLREQIFHDGIGTVRDFNITPSGNYIIAGNQMNNQVILFKIDKEGKLSPTGKMIELPQPSCFVYYQEK